MAKGEEITTKFKVDISDLKKGITEANNQIKLANAQFKAATSGMDDWTKSADGLNAKLEQLKSVLAAQTTKMKSYQNQLKEIEKAKTENGKRADELKKKLQELANQGISKTSDEYKKYEKALNEVEKESLANEKAADKLKVTILNQKAVIDGTVKEMRNYKTGLDGVESESHEAEKANKDLAKSLQDVEKNSSKLKDGFTVLKGAFASLVADGIRKGISALKDFGSEMISTAAAVKAENAQFEQTFGDMGDEAEKAIKKVANSTGILETRLKSTGAQIYAFARSNGATVPQAMELMEESLQAAADGAAYYDKSLEESAETLQSFLKGNYANDAALGVSATEFTRNAKATELFGKKFNDLTEIQKQQTLLKMVTDAQKVSGAFGQAARESDGWENVMGNLNETWRQFQAKVGAPFLEALIPIIQQLTKDFDKWSKSVDWNKWGQDVKNAVGKVIDVFQWIIKNHTLVENGVKLMVAAFAVNKITSFTKGLIDTTLAIKNSTVAVNANKAATLLFSNVTRTATVAQNAHTVATNLGTVAGRTFNAVWKANPIGVVVTAVTLLTTGIIALSKHLKDSTKSIDENFLAAQKLAAEQKELNQAVKEAQQTRKEAIESTEKEGATADILAQKLIALNGVQDKTAAQKQTMKNLVNELNKIMPELNLKYDEEKDKLNMTTEALKLNVEAQKEMLKAKAAQANLAPIAEQMAEVEMKQLEITKLLNKANEELLAATEERMKAYEAYAQTGFDSFSQEYDNYIKTIGKENQKKLAYEETLGVLKDNQTQLEGLNKEYDKTNEYAENMFSQAEIQQQLVAITDAAKKSGIEIPKAVSDGIKEGTYQVPQSITELKDLITFDESLKKAKEAGVSIPTQLKEGITSGQTKPKEAIDIINQLMSYQGMIDKAGLEGVKIPKSLSDSIINGETTVKQATASMNNWIEFNKAVQESTAKGIAIPKELANNIVSGKTSVTDAVAQMNNWVQFTEALAASDKAGAKIPVELEQGILSGKVKPKDAIAQLNTDLLNETNKLPSKVRKSGITTGSSYLDGVLKGTEDTKRRNAIYQSSDKVGKDMVDKFNQRLEVRSPSKATERSGQYFLDGIKNGVTSGNKQNSIFSAIVNLGSTMLAKFKAALQEKSPSKATEKMGQYLLDGLAIGLDDEESGVLKKVSNLGKNIVETLQNELNENVDIQNTIDNLKGALSKAKVSLPKINVPTLNNASAATQNGTSNNTSKNIINNFNQIINAPKTPSRIDIYRDTRNLLNLKGGA